MSRVRSVRMVKYHKPMAAWNTLGIQMRLLGMKIRRTEKCIKRTHPDRRERIQKDLDRQRSELDKLRLRKSLAIQQIGDMVEHQNFGKGTLVSVYGV